MKMNLRTVTALTLSLAFAATLAAAPQATKPAAPKPAPAAKAEPAKPAAAKPAKPMAEKVMAADIPAPVKDAVMKAHPKAAISGATKTMAGSVAWYKVSYKDGAKTASMTVDAMGKEKPKK